MNINSRPDKCSKINSAAGKNVPGTTIYGLNLRAGRHGGLVVNLEYTIITINTYK